MTGAAFDMSSREGFLSKDLANHVLKIRADFAQWFSVADSFNALGMRVLALVGAPDLGNQQLVVALAYRRVFTSFQAACLLAERGMLADTRNIVRGAAETAIILRAVAKDEAVCRLLGARQYWHHAKLRSIWLQDKEASAELTQADIDAIKATIAQADIDYPKGKDLKGDPIQLASLAQKSGSMTIYNAIFRWNSGDGAHTSLDSLNRHLLVDANGVVNGLRFGPEVADLPDTIHGALFVFSQALEAVFELFKLSQLDEELGQCTRAFIAMPFSRSP